MWTSGYAGGPAVPGPRMNGLGRLALKSARWADRPGQGYGWVEAPGELTSGQGTIGLGLLRALDTEMKFRLPPKLAWLALAGSIDFRTLGFSFAMTPDGELRFDGVLGNEFAPDAVLAGRPPRWPTRPKGPPTSGG